MRKEVFTGKDGQAAVLPAQRQVGTQGVQGVVDDGGAVARRVVAGGEVEGLPFLLLQGAGEGLALRGAQELRTGDGDALGKARRAVFGVAAGDDLVGARGVVVGGGVEDAHVRLDGDDDADVRPFAVARVADDGAFPSCAGTEDEVADGQRAFRRHGVGQGGKK